MSFSPANALFMVVPDHFGFNLETAHSNTFQQFSNEFSVEDIKSRAQSEFAKMVIQLKHAGLNVYTKKHEPGKQLPDAVFPNNWVSFMPDGTIIVFPMMTESRRAEKHYEFIHQLVLETGYKVKTLVDLSYFEKRGKYLEGTGSLVLDHVNNIAYSSLSPRTNKDVVEVFCELTNYKPIVFHTKSPKNGLPVYHTNVIMALATDLAFICLECIIDEQERKRVINEIELSGRSIVEISYLQVESFAGNMLELENIRGESLMVMSETAYQTLLPEQVHQIGRNHELLIIKIPIIEKIGGGSVRCMMAEIFVRYFNK